MNSNLAQDKSNKIELKRQLPFSLWMVLPYTVWFAIISAYAIRLTLFEHQNIIYLMSILALFIAWYFLVLNNAILFYQTKRVTTGKIVKRERVTHLDSEHDEYYQYFVTVEFKPENEKLNEAFITLAARVAPDAYPSSKKEDIIIAYASEKPQLAILERESLLLSEINKGNKAKKRDFKFVWKYWVFPRTRLLLALIGFAIGGVLSIIGLDRHVIYFISGLLFLTISFYIATDKCLRYE